MTDGWDETKAAPHGRDPETNEPLTPYGVNRDGSPRKSNRGARPGQRGNSSRRRSAPRSGSRSSGAVSMGSKTDRARKEALVGLADLLVITPLGSVAASPAMVARVGSRQAEALAGDAVILANYVPHLADGLIVLSQSKPGALAWLDKLEERAPYVMLMSVGVQMTRALVENHVHPNPELAKAGLLMAQMRSQELATAVMREAAEMGIPTPDDFAPSSPNGSEPAEPTIPMHTAN